jgi:hypothetical protein
MSSKAKALPSRVRVYRNLHKKRWSVQHKTPKGWRVWGHTTEIILERAELKVNRAGRERVIFLKRKNVHAYVIGDPIFVRGWTLKTPITKTNQIEITYDPYCYSSFVSKRTKEKITHAQEVRLAFPSAESSPKVWATI